MLIDWDYCAPGIWRVLTKQEKEAPAPRGGHWSGAPPPPDGRPRPWSDRLSEGLLDDLQAWNDSWDTGKDRWKEGQATVRALQEQGRDLAIRVQDELGTDGWEVLYRLGDRMFRVHPPGSWPAEPGNRNSSATHRETGRTPKGKARVLRADHEWGRRTAGGGLSSPRQSATATGSRLGSLRWVSYIRSATTSPRRR